MKKPSPQNHSVLDDMERVIALEAELTKFNNERSLFLTESRLRVAQTGGTTLMIDELSPQSSYYNRVIGFGPADLERLTDILAEYGEAGIDPCFDMTPNRQTGEVVEALAAKGFVPRLQLAVLKNERIGEDPGHEGWPQPGAEFEIACVSGEEEALSFIGLIERSRGGEGMAPDEAVARRKSGYFYRDDFQNFVAYADGEPAGMGSLFIRGDSGYLANDFTFPEQRRRGVQTALIRHRLRTAASLGLKRVYTDVEFASGSHANMLKCGFELVYVNAFWMKSALPQ